VSAREYPPSSPHWWGWKYYGGHPTTRLLVRYGLTPAPPTEDISDAARESQAQRAARDERERTWRRKQAEDAQALRARFAADQHRRDTEARWASMSEERRAAIREDIARFGIEPVLTLWRHMLRDESFDVPEDVKEQRR